MSAAAALLRLRFRWQSLAAIACICQVCAFIGPRHVSGQDTARENSRVKKSRDKDKSPARPGSHGPPLVDRLFRELRDLMRQPRDLPACIVLVNDLALRRSHELRLGARHRL